MSKLTIKQRIALVAIAAMGGSLISITSATTANASPIAYGDVTAPQGSTGIVTAYSASAVTMSADGVFLLNFATATAAVGVTGGKITGFNPGSSTAPGNTNGVVITADGSGAAWSALAVVGMQFKPTAAGTNMVIKVWGNTAAAAATPTTAAASAAAGTNLRLTITATIVAAGLAGTYSAGKSYISVNALGSSSATVADDANANIVRGNVEARINYSLTDALGTAGTANMPANTLTNATVTSGSCLVGTSAAGGTLTTAQEYANSGDFFVASTVYPAPTNCTVAVSVDGVVRSTKTFTFQGEVSKITYNGPSFTGKTGTTTAAPAGTGYITAQDSAGNNLGGISLSPDATTYGAIVSSAPAVTTGSQTNGYVASSVPSTVTFACTAVGGSTTIKFTASQQSGATVSSAAIPVRCAKDADTYKASLDKASYAPGDIATLTITALDTAGRNTNDAMVLGTSTANGPSILGSQLTAVTAPTYTDTFSGGIKTYKYIVGSTVGSYNLVVDLPYLNSISTTGQAAVTIAYKVVATSTDVTNADVLKSIVALIASINKQIQALQKLILKR